MSYEKEIWQILTEVGDRGLSVAKISRHVHHACNTLFSTVDYADIHRDVAQYLLRNSKNPDSVIEKTDRGIYRLNMKSKETSQLVLQFREKEDDAESEQKPTVDLSLSLF